MEQDQLYLGIDGGGTRTVAWLGTRCGNELNIVGRGNAGCGNARVIGLEAVAKNVQYAISQAFVDARVDQRQVEGLHLSLAGVGRPEEKRAMQAWAEAQLDSRRVTISSDVEVILAACEQPDGIQSRATIALVAGTGSIVFGKSTEGKQARCGGWGFLLGDQGSAFDISLQLLRLACRTADGLESEHKLLDAILDATGCAGASELIGWTYDVAGTRERVAAFARLAFEPTLQCPAVQGIVESCAKQLAEAVVATARQLLVKDFALAIAGGLICNQPSYERIVLDCCQRMDYAPRQAVRVTDPVLGSLRLAAGLSQL